MFRTARCISLLCPRFVGVRRLHGDTICALSSGRGKCAVSVLRVSGCAAPEVLRLLTAGKAVPKPRQASLRTVFHPQDGSFLDQSLVLWFPSPNSSTGEDVCEFHVHGGRAVIDGVLNAILGVRGCRLAEPGEFTQRAFANGKLDLLQVEGLSDLIQAETKVQREQASKALTGSASKFYEEITTKILECSAELEAFIDFSEEHSFEDDNMVLSIVDKVHACKQAVDELVKQSRRSRRIKDGVKLAVLGPPNAGKSSLLNQLARDDVSIVSSIAGTTRDVVERTLDVSGYPVVVQDTAGLRSETEADEIERIGMTKALKTAEECDIAVFVIDATTLDVGMLNTGDLRSSLLEHLQNDTGISALSNFTREDRDEEGAAALFVLNKEDLLSEDRQRQLAELASDRNDVIVGSCISPAAFQRVHAFLAYTLARLCDQNAPAFEGAVVIRERHRKNLELCSQHLEEFLEFVSNSASGTLDAAVAGQHLRFAARSIASLTNGGFTTEDVLGKIFSEFCVGK